MIFAFLGVTADDGDWCELSSSGAHETVVGVNCSPNARVMGTVNGLLLICC